MIRYFQIYWENTTFIFFFLKSKANELEEVPRALAKLAPLVVVKEPENNPVDLAWNKWLNTLAPEQSTHGYDAENIDDDEETTPSPDSREESVPDPAVQLWEKMAPCLEDLKNKYLAKVFSLFDAGLPTGEPLSFNFKAPSHTIVITLNGHFQLNQM
jgi:hypothetical protein